MGTQLPPPQQGGRAPNFWPTAGWIKIALGMEMGLGPGHIVLDGDPVSPPKKGTQLPPISAHVYCRQMAGWIKMPLGTEVGLGPGDAVLDGDPAPPKRGTALPPIFSPCLLWPRSPISATAELLLPLIFAVLLVNLISKVQLHL